MYREVDVKVYRVHRWNSLRNQMSANLNLTYEQLRGVVLRALQHADKAQLAGLYSLVASYAAKMRGESSVQQNVIGPRYSDTGFMVGEQNLSGYDKGRVQDILFDLFVEGIARPGFGDGMNDGLPFYHVTEWGRQVIVEGPGAPYDPDGYLARIKADIATLDPIITTYLNESLHRMPISVDGRPRLCLREDAAPGYGRLCERTTPTSAGQISTGYRRPADQKTVRYV